MRNHSEALEKSIIEYKLIEKADIAFSKQLSIFHDTADQLNLPTQMKMFSSLPNFHKWLWNLNDPSKQQVKFEQRFASCSHYSPSSPHNRILSSFLNGGGEATVYNTLKVMLGAAVWNAL